MQKRQNPQRVNHWEIITDNLSKVGWSWGCVSAIDSSGRTIWIADAYRDDGLNGCFYQFEAFLTVVETKEINPVMRPGELAIGIKERTVACNSLFKELHGLEQIFLLEKERKSGRSILNLVRHHETENGRTSLDMFLVLFLNRSFLCPQLSLLQA
jgi:hypothetical protein